jgi:hypothetical protein
VGGNYPIHLWVLKNAIANHFSGAVSTLLTWLENELDVTRSLVL